jgi:proteasome lid subunit RPN8/RPN11
MPSANGQPEPIRIRRWRFRELVRELAKRGRGNRESGAVLLARTGDERRRVNEVIYLDELDPNCLQGGISMRGSAYTHLWALCRRRGLVVVADVHTHPTQHVAQSGVDKRNPLVARRGHLALIVPNFAQGKIKPEQIGVHQYLGDHRWAAHHGSAAARIVQVTWW